MLLRDIIKSLKSIIRPPRTSPNTSAQGAETIEAWATQTARAWAQAPTPGETARAHHSHQPQDTDPQLYTPSPSCEPAASPNTSRQPSFAQSQESLPESAGHSLLHRGPAYEADTESNSLAEKNIYVREVELSTSSSARIHSRPTSAESALEPSLPPASPVPSLLFDDELEIMQRKIWVKRPGASATLVTVNDDDLVDTVRDMILRKYANSLGKSVDSPDITLKIVPREQANKNAPSDRVLGPDESIGGTLESYYPGGQTIEEALLIDVPQRRTPRPSPRIGNHHPTIAYPYYVDDSRPSDGAREYFPPMAIHSPHLPQVNGAHLPHSIGILATGQVPALPSPGGHSTRRNRDGRPKYVKQPTSSPTILHSTQPHSSGKTGTVSA